MKRSSRAGTGSAATGAAVASRGRAAKADTGRSRDFSFLITTRSVSARYTPGKTVGRASPAIRHASAFLQAIGERGDEVAQFIGVLDDERPVE
ncbi:hypothetical protein ACFPK5_37730 [Streptomyces beijiangensis]|uniref:hypothetical protein n=1 Tax=Streptomyces beijiangensis TaxID=163361 RepID=UPI003609E186